MENVLLGFLKKKQKKHLLLFEDIMGEKQLKETYEFSNNWG